MKRYQKGSIKSFGKIVRTYHCAACIDKGWFQTRTTKPESDIIRKSIAALKSGNWETYFQATDGDNPFRYEEIDGWTVIPKTWLYDLSEGENIYKDGKFNYEYRASYRCRKPGRYVRAGVSTWIHMTQLEYIIAEDEHGNFRCVSKWYRNYQRCQIHK